MDIPMLIRAGIFFVAGALVLVFPKQVLEWQLRTIARLEKIFPPVKHLSAYSIFQKKYWGKTNWATGIAFLVISAILLFFGLS
ncbi:hypothetical protein ACFLQ2_03190 [archaeon]